MPEKKTQDPRAVKPTYEEGTKVLDNTVDAGTSFDPRKHFVGMEISPLERQIATHEGYSNLPYLDTVNKKTVGVGRNIDDKPLKIDERAYLMKDPGRDTLSDDQIMYIFRNDIRDAQTDARAVIGPAFDLLSETRQNVLVDMSFNLGRTRLAKFEDMKTGILKGVATGDFEDAAKEMVNSDWYGQVKGRGVTLVNMMKKG